MKNMQIKESLTHMKEWNRIILKYIQLSKINLSKFQIKRERKIKQAVIINKLKRGINKTLVR